MLAYKLLTRLDRSISLDSFSLFHSFLLFSFLRCLSLYLSTYRPLYVRLFRFVFANGARAG